jgi:hypothetical protein
MAKYVIVDRNPDHELDKKEYFPIPHSEEEEFGFLELVEQTDWTEEEALAIARLDVDGVYEQILHDIEHNIIEHWQIKRVE